ncbi:MAG TPA: hypothetical protein VE287_02090 [Actinopolymorphaceae bacterium]|jgi:hypothetical protein|nr:hypothetical protein [Actinopolymorphaceae bacterium]
MPQDKTGRTATWTPAPHGAATTFLRRYDTVNSRAGAVRDPRLIASVESGPLLRASVAAYRIAKRLDPKDKNPDKPPTHEHPHVYLPSFTGYPVWFVAVSTLAHDGRTAVDLVYRPSAGAMWKKAQSVVLDKGASLPSIAERNGTAVAVTGAADGLVRPPDKAALAYARLLEGGPSAPQAHAFVPHPDTERAHGASAANRKQSNAFTYDQKFTVTSVRALATDDGEALVLFTMQETEALGMRNSSLRFKKDDAIAAYTGLARGQAFLRTSWIWQVAAVIPANGGSDPRIRLLGTQRSLAAATMR